MRVFTKRYTVPFSHLRRLGPSSAVYIYGSYFQDDSYKASFDNVLETTKALR